ncbi:GNAT family N-acetyltransferase [Aestuariibacter halophilus]|uniref:GNAT family N-acetyltransferase n=1 Tax=Fluctibacter halophilus TaxID=226011 RepID=A0ABS8G550_9ALTE|nr:GNAT family N-acetyltransferase [Aestuariibacter halophilus]MCC2615000.1 GNAT family N-acetyltransferase [Aestuariibacter halophilus]
MTLSLKQASQADLDYLLTLRKLTMTEHLERAGRFLTDAEHLDRVAYGLAHAHLLRVGSTTAGMIKYIAGDQQLDILQLQIHPQHQNQGLGRRVLEMLIQQLSPDLVNLSVLKGNPAIALYQRMGFVVVADEGDEWRMHLTLT